MAMNRAQKRMLQKQGALGADGEAVRERPQPRKAPAPRSQDAPKEKRATPREFLKEVRGELRKVAWPTRAEVVNYSIISFYRHNTSATYPARDPPRDPYLTHHTATNVCREASYSG